MDKFRKRIFIFYILLSMVMVALIGRLVYIQVVWGDELSAMAAEQQNKNIPIPAIRGEILDRNGDKLAFSIKTYTVWAKASVIKKPVETAELIANIITADVTTIVDKIIASQSVYVKIMSGLSKSESELIKSEGIIGISVEEDTKRMYPFGRLASHVIGNVNADGNGFLGLEQYYNAVLEGTAGLNYVTTDVYGRELANGESTLKEAIDGQSVQLTLDDTIQFFVEQRLEEAMIKHSAKSASAIVMDPNTGEILAMTTKPDFDLNSPRAYNSDMDPETWETLTADEQSLYWNEMWKNVSISNTYEPGSTFKTITAAIALEEKKVTLESRFYDKGFIEVKGIPLYCWFYPEKHGDETFLQAFVNSCNPVFVEVGAKIGTDVFYEYLDKFGLFEKTGIDLPSEANSIILAKDRVGPIELATMSYGHGANTTMIQMLRTISALVNGGHLMEPHVVKSIIDSEGNIIEKIEPKIIRDIVSTETSENIKTLLESAVKTGGGKNAFIEGIRVGGKTGTSEKFVDSSYEEKVVLVSFVGVAPINDPKFIVLVIVDEPKDEFGGSLVAAPIVKGILEDILRYKNIVPDVAVEKQIVLPQLIGMTIEQAIAELDKLGLSHSTDPIDIEDQSLIVTKQYPQADSSIDVNSIVILSVEE